MELMKLQLQQLKEDEKELKGTVEGLKKSMGKANKEICDKEETILKLSKKIQELRERNMENIDIEEFLDKLWNLKENPQIRRDTWVREARTDPILIFPEEIWRMIFDNVSDPKDLWNLCNSCQFFDDILYQWKIGWMFEQTMPHLYPHLPGNKILECRRMCKSWNATVLNFLENHPSLRPATGLGDPHRRLEFVNPLKEKGLCGRNRIDFISTERHVPLLELADFPSIFPSSQNPFIGRHVYLCIGEDDYTFRRWATEEDRRINDQLWIRVHRFLEYFGKHLWYLRISLPAELTEQSRLKFRDFISQRVFKMVPKLRKLRIDVPFVDEAIIDIEPTSFPPMPELESLECTCFFVYTPLLVKALLIRYHNQLRKILVTPNIWEDVRHLDWANLAELHLNPIWEYDLESLYNVRMPNLTKLALNLDWYIDLFTFDKLLEVIHNVSSISHLTALRLDGYKRHEAMLKGFPTLPLTLNKCAPVTLKTLEMDHLSLSSPPSYDFLLRCFPLLENLHLYLKKEPLDGSGEIDLKGRQECSLYLSGLRSRPRPREDIIEINKYLCEGNMYKSNVWELLPRLKVLSFQWDVFTREGYEDYVRKMKVNV